jgi:hypothetical protein
VTYLVSAFLDQLLSSERLTESDLPTSSLSRSTISAPKRRKQSLGGSPIAADGGFGPMDYEESDESDDETANDTHDAKDEEAEEAEEAEEGFGDDFDDFEAGAEGEDFGEFDDGFREPEQPQGKAEQPVEPDTSSLSPFVSRFIIAKPSHQPHITKLSLLLGLMNDADDTALQLSPFSTLVPWIP